MIGLETGGHLDDCLRGIQPPSFANLLATAIARISHRKLQSTVNRIGLHRAIRKAHTGDFGVRHQLAADQRLDTSRDGRIDAQQIRGYRHIPLPTYPHQRVTLLQQIRVGALEHPQEAFAAAIGNFKQDGPVALGRIARFEHREVCAEEDQPSVVYRCAVNVANDLVGRQLGVCGEVRTRHNALVGPGSAEALTVLVSIAMLDVNLRYRAKTERGNQHHQQNSHVANYKLATRKGMPLTPEN